MAAEPLAETAPAKVNLYLHVTGRRDDGYHELESLVAFPAHGDRLWAEPGPGLSLAVDGPFAGSVPTGPGNLILRAAEALAAAHGLPARAALRLEKELPVAAGIGGGSADAAAALRLLSRLWEVAVPEGLAAALGADVPVCLSAPAPQMMRGIGERIEPVAPLPEAWILLVNPGLPVETGPVFAALERTDTPPGSPPDRFQGFSDLVAWLTERRNDLEPAARKLCPAVAAVLEALGSAPLARMSGSGATCFALHPDREGAEAQAERVRQAHPEWWILAAPLSVRRVGDRPG